MTLRHLRVFVAVAEQGKMRTAAKDLFISQSAVSQTVNELENHYNAKLFERLSHKLYITPAGKQLLSYARHILALYNEMELNMHCSAEQSEIRIGATIMVGTCIVGTLLRHYRLQHPQVNPSVYIGNGEVLGQLLRDSSLDFLLMESPFPEPNFLSEEVLDDPMVLICSPQHPFSHRRSVTLEEISREPFIGRERSERPEAFDEIMAAHNFTTNVRWVSNNSEATKNAVMENHGITVISRRIVSEEIDAGLLCAVPIEGEQLRRKVRLVYHKNKFISTPLEDMFQLCRKLEEIVP